MRLLHASRRFELSAVVECVRHRWLKYAGAACCGFSLSFLLRFRNRKTLTKSAYVRNSKCSFALAVADKIRMTFKAVISRSRSGSLLNYFSRGFYQPKRFPAILTCSRKLLLNPISCVSRNTLHVRGPPINTLIHYTLQLYFRWNRRSLDCCEQTRN